MYRKVAAFFTGRVWHSKNTRNTHQLPCILGTFKSGLVDTGALDRGGEAVKRSRDAGVSQG